MNDKPALSALERAMPQPHAAKVALITGITGQDGSYLTELLLDKGYVVHGIVRRSSSPNTSRIDHLLGSSDAAGGRLFLHDGDLTDAAALMRIMAAVRPDEVYNLAAQSHVACSFEVPEYTAQTDALGPLRLLEAIRTLGLTHRTRFYQASTSELYGQAQASPQAEDTPFAPRSPYAAAKLYAYWITVNYREAYGIYACNGILFNHESPRRGNEFVTRKITLALARIACGQPATLRLGNLAALRDWGHARDYVAMQWLMLQQPDARDYVIATGVHYSVRHFVDCAAHELGITLAWSGTGLHERAHIAALQAGSAAAAHCRCGQLVVQIDPALFRPTEVATLLGDASRARLQLGWTPQHSFAQLVRGMVQADLALAMAAAPASAPAAVHRENLA
ncbi:GDPmannose 4,6-dehydratase [Duganella sp. CF402]|uniref:GDP-mannose 4,6-dehydratase n=1 Tax=unclassified Duganella TaxID=2636909 RepID=UPI0008AC35DD|nr:MULTISPECIES: GDP-mannose 4,6-dehydratase [unclassified Duganella]RZT10189.1 GDPmannose 4,6-dehydratase [Duganella sp. BK701]SEL24131.1 GDPmannose 4,6-dehydratase [Duganella sp. CF402]